MSAGSQRPLFLLVAALCAAILAVGCSDESATDPPRPTGAVASGSPATKTPTTTTTVAREAPDPASPDIMAAAALELVTVDHTFEIGSRPFSTFLVQDHIDPVASSDHLSDATDPRPLSRAERRAIDARLGPLGTVEWIDDAAARQGPEANASASGTAILDFGEPTSDGGTGLVPVTLTCGDLCGTTFTYRLSLDAGGTWVITGKAGPVTVS